MPKLMLVEDDNNLREIYEARLQAEGYDIVSAKDGEEALVVAKAEKPDLIISDVMMPKISGFEMLDILRNTEGMKEVKVIMLTALGQSDDQQRADRLGADRYLVKSQVTLEDIVKVAHDLLGDAPGDSVAPTAEPAASAAPAEPAVVAVAPEPVPAPEPVAAEPAAAPVASDDSPQSTVQEEAAVEAQIEDFVAGATDVPAAAVPAPAPEPVVQPAASTSDDKLITDAVDTLVASTEPVVEPTVAPTDPAPAPTPAADPASDQVTVAGKKVITPLQSEPKKDLDALVAAEEAKESGAPTPSAPTAVVGTDKAPAKSAPAAGEVDPNSIAL